MNEHLLSNGACEVVRSASRLECETGPSVFDWALAALAGCGAAVALRFLVDDTDGGARLVLAVAILMGCLVGAWQVRRRLAAVGRVTVDRDTRELVRVEWRGTERRWGFAQVRRMELREDGFDASRPDLFPTSPSWLEIELEDGTILHLAKGSVDELRPVVQTLELWQFRAMAS